MVVGALYTLPLARHFGDLLATVNSYHSQRWQGGWLFGFPFYAIIHSDENSGDLVVVPATPK